MMIGTSIRYPNPIPPGYRVSAIFCTALHTDGSWRRVRVLYVQEVLGYDGLPWGKFITVEGASGYSFSAPPFGIRNLTFQIEKEIE